jgi:heme exporter protein B
LPRNSAGLAGKAFAVYAKDLQQELRTRYAVSTILLFGIAALAMVSYSLGQSGLPPKMLSALFWVIMFFSSMAGLAQAFIREEEAGTSLALRLNADPGAVYLGKLFFNLTLLSAITIVVTPGFFLFMDAPTDGVGIFVLITFLGVLALCAATTLVAAIIARAAMKGALFAVVALPIVIVPMMVLVGAGARALDGGSLGQVAPEIQVLIAYTVVMVTASYLLFRFVWLE